MAKNLRLDELAVKQLGISNEEAVGLIMSGRIFIGNLPADKPGEPVSPDTILTLRDKSKRYASRSGYKLEKALQVFDLDVYGLIACDIGASNGGFTDCLLQHGAAHVYSVDVAYGIMAWELRCDERVTVLERTNARSLDSQKLGEKCNLITADVSFISLKKIFPAIDKILKPDGFCVCLIKPQFEASSAQVGKNGTLRNPDDLPPLLESIASSAFENRLYLKAVTVSPIRGTNGNIEYLALFDRNNDKTRIEWTDLINKVVLEKPDR
ncbi:MAG: TlyA family RNA methyltransferase [Oscillospiraceae bacterium]|nr:TlyA family RNA methyltransferase [Oscillospiraceae bacterium]MDD4413676.1 TlyA family RNA methyltransferase [Oscillospiraceae bacterium]